MNLFVNPAIPFVNLALSPPSNARSQTKLREFGDADYQRFFAEKSQKLLLLVFGSTWCKPCIEMEPDLARLAVKWRNKVEILKVTAPHGDKAASVADHLFERYFEGYPEHITVPSAVLLRGGAILGRYDSDITTTTAPPNLEGIKRLLSPYMKGSK